MTWTSYFHEKIILITGAGNGIGRGLAISLSQYCKSLILIDIHESNLEETASLCSKRALVRRLILDVRDAQKCSEEFLSYPCPDIIIANAGLGGLNPANGFSTTIDHKIMSVNYFGTVNSVAPFIPQLIQRLTK